MEEEKEKKLSFRSLFGINSGIRRIRGIGYEWVELYCYTTYMPSWRGQGQMYFLLVHFTGEAAVNQ
jgi:hypothetical protein